MPPGPKPLTVEHRLSYLLGMQKKYAHQVMSEDVVSASPSTPYRDIVELMVRHDIAALPVIDEAERVLGTVSEVDLLRHSELESVVASALMVARPPVIGPFTTVVEAAHLMVEARLKQLPVVDEADRLIGIVSLSDLLPSLLPVVGELAVA